MKNIFKYSVLLFLFSINIVQAQTLRIDSLTQKLVTEKEDTSKVTTLNSLAHEFGSNNPDTAIYFGNKALALATKLNYKMGIADANLWKGFAMMTIGEYVEALKNSNDALEIYDLLLSSENAADKAKILKQKATAYSVIGVIYWYQGDYPEALRNHFASLKIREEIGDKQGIAMSHNNIGVVYWYQGNYSEGLKNHFTSLKIRDEIGDKKGIAMSYNNIGVIYLDQGNYPEALKNYFASLKIKEEIGDKQGIAQSYNNIGRIYEKQDNYPEALKNHFASIKISEEIGDKIGVTRSYNNIGEIYTYKDNYPEALKNYSASLKICEEIGDKKGIATAYTNIGSIYTLQSNYAEALKNHFVSLKIKEEIGDKKGIAGTSSRIGNIYTHQKKFLKASEYLNRGLTLAKEIGSLDNIKECYDGLATLDSAQGNYKQALESYKMFIITRDSLFNEENSEKLVQSQMQYEFDKKEAATRAEQNIKDVVAKEELQKQKIQKYAFIGGIVLLVILSVLLYNRFRLKRLLDFYQLREDIASDLHDNIGSTLGSISYYSEMAQQLPEEKRSQLKMLLHKIEDSSNELVDEMSDIVWAINPANDSFEKLITRMNNYGIDFLATRSIDFSLQTKDVIESLRLSIEQRKNIFLIFKEAVYNAVKYACCTGFNASFQQTNHKLIVELSDNGKGFDVNQPMSYNGNGISNMKKRAKEIGAEFSILSNNGKGTRIRFEMPIRKL